MRRRLFNIIEHSLAVAGGILIIYHLAFHVTVITSGSMQPTLCGTSKENGDWVLTECITGRWREPKRFEVIAFVDELGVSIMKRVIGLPGETVSMQEGVLMVDENPLSLPPFLQAVSYRNYGNLREGNPVSCGAGYYVLGDDSIDSLDSRFTGPILKDRLLGRAWVRIWPASRMGWAGL